MGYGAMGIRDSREFEGFRLAVELERLGMGSWRDTFVLFSTGVGAGECQCRRSVFYVYLLGHLAEFVLY